MHNKTPKVTIIIPVYNGSNYLEYAINSALSQTYDNIEVLVINDGSRDDGASERIALSYGDRIRYIHKENGGVSTALNLGIEKMHGDLVCWLSHDDMYEINKVEKEVQLYLQQENPESIIFCGYKIINSCGIVQSEYFLPEYACQHLDSMIGLDLQYTLNGCTMLIPRRVFEKYGKFDVSLRYTQDYDLWHTFLVNGVPFVYLNESLMLSRSHGEQGGKIAPVAVTLEADALHARIIHDLDPDDVREYLEGDIEKLVQVGTVYGNAGYPATQSRIQGLYRRLSAAGHSKGFHRNLGIEDLNIHTELSSHLVSPEKFGDKERRTVIFCNTGWFVGGVERVISILLPHLSKTNNMIMLSVTDDTSNGFELQQDVMFVAMSPEGRIPIANRIASFAEMYHCDIFVGHANVSDPFFEAFGILRGLGIKTVMMNHYNYFLPYQLPACRAMAHKRDVALHKADIGLWLTDIDVYSCAHKYGALGVMPNPNTFDYSDEHKAPKVPVLLAVGRYTDPNKRIDRVFDIYAEVLKQVPECRLEVVGPYDPDLYIQEANSTAGEIYSAHHFTSQKVHFVSQQPNVQEYYERATVALITSNSEGFGMVISEAMTCGVPVVGVDYFGISGRIHNDYNGYHAKTTAQAAQYAVQLIKNKNKYKQICANAQKYAGEFKPETIAAKWNKLFELLLDPMRLTSEQVLEQAGLLPSTEHKDKMTAEILAHQEKLIAELAPLTVGAPTVGAAPAPAGIAVQESIPTGRYQRLWYLLKRSLKVDGWKATLKRMKAWISKKVSSRMSRPVPEKGLRRILFLLCRSLYLDGCLVTLKRIARRVFGKKEH